MVLRDGGRGPPSIYLAEFSTALGRDVDGDAFSASLTPLLWTRPGSSSRTSGGASARVHQSSKGAPTSGTRNSSQQGWQGGDLARGADDALDAEVSALVVHV